MTHMPAGPLFSLSSLSREPTRAPHEIGPLGREFQEHEALGRDFTPHEFLEHGCSGQGSSAREVSGQERDGAGSGGGTGTGPPGHDVPPTGTVPLFPPLPVRRAGVGRLWPGRRPGRGLALALLALCGGLLVAVPSTGAGAPSAKASGPERAGAHATGTRPAPDRHAVRTAVRIAEPAGLRLVRPGDRVDVIAVSGTGRHAARVVVAGARIAALPRPPGDAMSSPPGTMRSAPSAMPSASGGTTASLPGSSPESVWAQVWPEADAETRWDATDSGAVIVLTVPRASAVDLAAASASSALAVVAC